LSYVDCAALSLELDEDMVGTAPSERGILVIEIPGPWGRDVLTESRLGEDLGRAIEAKAKAAGLRVQGVRRLHRRYDVERPHAWLAGVGDGSRFLEAFTLGAHADLLDLDLQADRPTGEGKLENEPLFLVCTHSTRDACCARRGLPLAREVLRVAPGRTWHASHLGGHRFAATMACLPLGAWLGRVGPDEAAEVVAACVEGRLPLDHMRGVAGKPPAAQAAEVALWRELGHEVRVAAVEGDVVRFTDGHEVEMRRVPTGTVRAVSCGVKPSKQEDPGRWETVRISRAAASPRG
jgi:hypothetical protein